MAVVESVGSELYSNGKRVWIDGDTLTSNGVDVADTTYHLRDNGAPLHFDGTDRLFSENEIGTWAMQNYSIDWVGVGYPDVSYGNAWTTIYISNTYGHQIVFGYIQSTYNFRILSDGVWGEWKVISADVVGEIKLYTGKVVDIPQGWNIANGTKGTVDMSADFKTYGTDEVVYIQYTGGN